MVALEFVEDSEDWFRPEGVPPAAPPPAAPPMPPPPPAAPPMPPPPLPTPPPTIPRDAAQGDADCQDADTRPGLVTQSDPVCPESHGAHEREAASSADCVSSWHDPRHADGTAYPNDARDSLAKHVGRIGELELSLDKLEKSLKTVLPINAQALIKQRRETLDMLEHLKATLPEAERLATAEQTVETEGRFAAAWKPLVAERENMLDDLTASVESLRAVLDALHSMTRRQGAALDTLRSVRDPRHTQFALAQGDVAVMGWVLRRLGAAQEFPQISQYLPIVESLRGAQYVALREKP